MDTGTGRNFLGVLGILMLITIPTPVHSLLVAPPEFLNIRGERKFIQKIGEAVWIGMSTGVYRVDHGSANTVKIIESEAHSILPSGRNIWLGTADGVWQISGSPNKAVRKFPGKTSFLRKIDDDIWIGTARGVWRLSSGSTEDQLIVEGRAGDVKKIGNDVWIVTGATSWTQEHEADPTDGVWWLQSGSGTPIKLFPLGAAFVEEIAGDAWIGAKDGVWKVDVTKQKRVRLEGEKPIRIKAIDADVWTWNASTVSRFSGGSLVGFGVGRAVFVEKIGDDIWIGTDHGIWQLQQASTEPRRLIAEDVLFLEKVGDDFWIATWQALWRVRAKAPTPERMVEGPGQFVKEINGEVWIGIAWWSEQVRPEESTRRLRQGGIYRLTNGSAKPEHVITVGGATFVEKMREAIWLGNDVGLWRLTKRATEPEKMMTGMARSIKEIDGEIWLWADANITRILDAEARVVALHRADSWWGSFMESAFGALAAGPATAVIGYVGRDAKLLPEERKGLQVIVKSSRADYEEALVQKRFIASDVAHNIPVGFPTTLFVAIRNQWGNVFEQRMDVWVWPSEIPLVVGVGLAFVLSITVIFFLAPFNRTCHSLLMNPFLRRYASFGVIPLAFTTIPAARKHVLKRYRREMLRSEGFNRARTQYLPPSDKFLPPFFAQKLAAQRRLVVQGPSGIGKTAFFQFLCAQFALGNTRTELPKGIVPVYVPLEKFRSANVEQMIRAQLENFGTLTDQGVTDWMIRHGGFLLFLDGINEVPMATRDSVNSFVESSWLANWIAIGSQVIYRDFDHWGDVWSIEPLPPPKVDEWIRLHLGPDAGERVISQMTPELYHLYSNPQNLEIGLEALKKRPTEAMPGSLLDIYRGLFLEHFAAWRSGSSADYPDKLTERAYVMLRDKCDARYELAGHATPLPEAVLDFCLSHRLMVRHGSEIFFRHELLRAYLAAEHFVKGWRKNIERDKDKIDRSWRTMLEFAIEKIIEDHFGPEEVQEVVWAVLDVAPDLAAELVGWLEERHSEMSEGWRDMFDQLYGATLRKRQR